MIVPPPLPRRSSTNWKFLGPILGVALLTLLIGGYLAVRVIQSSDFARANDNLFGDQSLKTTVALIELHKVRFGRYPASLRDLKFTGQWDQISLRNVRYVCNPEGTAYYVEVVRGWIGKPTFTMPADFWRGTGYSPALGSTPPPR